MNRILRKRRLAPAIVSLLIEAPLVAAKARAGQFVILRPTEDGERIPLTIASCDKRCGGVEVVVQVVGGTTARLASKEEGEFIADFSGPLGNPTETKGIKSAVVVGGGVGCAIALPVARALSEEGCEVTSVIGFRNRELVIFEEEFRSLGETFVTTDDGSYGEKGNVCAPLVRRLERGGCDAVFVVGPLIMMKFAAMATKPFGVKTIASMNPIMIDGTGMCGCCRLTVGGEMKFACVDGPDFDAHLVDFDEAMTRAKSYAAFEDRAREKHCNLFREAIR